MGDTAPPQAAGLGAGLLGGGPAAPRVHSAIVERLRARIAVCRQHHLSCEGRYERGRAESSDRERESTLQLLHLVQQGQGARKTGKHPKAAAAGGSATPAAAAAPPDYHQHLLSNGGINGEQPAGEQRASALLAVSHSAPCRRGGDATRGREAQPSSAVPSPQSAPCFPQPSLWRCLTVALAPRPVPTRGQSCGGVSLAARLDSLCLLPSAMVPTWRRAPGWHQGCEEQWVGLPGPK